MEDNERRWFLDTDMSAQLHNGGSDEEGQWPWGSDDEINALVGGGNEVDVEVRPVPETGRLRPLPHRLGVPVMRRGNARVGDARRRVRAILEAPSGSEWCYTIQYKDDAEYQVALCIIECLMTTAGAVYNIMGLETAPTTGQQHMQGYIQFARTMRFNKMKELMPHGAHLEVAKGTCEQNQLYCKGLTPGKEPNVIWQEWGTPKVGQGHRSDLDGVKALLDTGATLTAVSQEFFGPFVRYHRGFQLYTSLNRKPSGRGELVLKWYWGETGTGKTSIVRHHLGLSDDGAEAYWLQSSPTGTWWNGYDGEKIVVMDELRAGWFPHNVMLRIFDRSPYRAPCHGMSVNLECNVIYITTNCPPRFLYKDDPSGALSRRVRDFAYVYEVVGPGPDVNGLKDFGGVYVRNRPRV